MRTSRPTPLHLLSNALLLAALLALPLAAHAAEQQPAGLHQMACFGHDFGSDTFIDDGWGWHALYWKECKENVTFDDWLAYPPVIFDPGALAADILNDNEADPNVFPGGDPAGGWVDFLNGTWDPGEELALASALCMDRWGSPLYGVVDLDGNGFADDVVAIRAVEFSGTDPSTICSNWSNTSISPEIVAGNCSFFEDFTVSRVWYAKWEFFGGYEALDESGSTFLARAACSGFTDYVCDPPAELAEHYREQHEERLPRRPGSARSGAEAAQQCHAAE